MDYMAGDDTVLGLDDLVVVADDWLVEDDSELGPVRVGQTLRHYIGVRTDGLRERGWEPSEDRRASVERLDGARARVTGVASGAGGPFDAFDIVCGPARFWMFCGAYDPRPVGDFVPAIATPADGTWVSVVGDLYIRPWYEVTEGAVMSARDMAVEKGWPISCDWLVTAVEPRGDGLLLHLAAVGNRAHD